MAIGVREASGTTDMATLRRLLEEYAGYLAANPTGAAAICLQNFGKELAGLPAPYLLLLVADVDGEAAGCVALKAMKRDGERACEMKRLWVRGRFQGLGIGRSLAVTAMKMAAAAGYEAMYLDTVPAAMPAANRLYASLGFEQIERYNDNPVSDVQFFRRSLSLPGRLQ